MTAATRSIKRSSAEHDAGGQIVPIQPRPSSGHPAQGTPRPSAIRPAVLAVGGQIGRYVLVDKLGQGSFGLIFTARDTVLDRAVAIKILNPAHQYNADVLRRFLQEALASARVVHPGIVTVHDFGTVPTSTGETAYIVLELLQGESLTARLSRTGRFTIQWAIEIGRQVASALDTAHRAGVLHRDLKSENIYLVPDPAAINGERVKVLDFGLAKIGASQHTQLNTVFGTPRYMSPEQCRSATNIDERSDIYSLGCIMFELLTGRTPFSGDIRAQLEGHKRAVAPRASQFVPDLPQPLDDLLAQMLAKDPNARPQTMAALQATLYAMNSAALAANSPVLHAASSAAFTMQVPVAPGMAATILPTAAEMISPIPQNESPIARLSRGAAMFQPSAFQVAPTEQTPAIPATPPIRSKRNSARQVTALPAAASAISLPRVVSVPYHLAPHLPSNQKPTVRASIYGAAITFLIAAVLTAIAARGHINTVNAGTVDGAPAAPAIKS
jgi:serine/threonine protein kinase